MAGNVAGVDIGTNSVRVLITDEHGAELERHMQITRLGQGVDKTGRLHPDAIARTVSVLSEYGALLRKHRVQKIRAAATSAARDAENSADFFDAAERALSVRPELLSGDEEALLSFRGATTGVDAALGPFLVVDIGGGSTEFVLGASAPEALISVDMGCVRMTDRHLKSDPPTSAEVEACRADVIATLSRVKSAVPYQRARTMIGLAGTITSLGAMAKGLKRYDPRETHHMRITRSEVARLTSELCAKNVEQRRAVLLDPKRAEVIAGGAIVLSTLLEELDLTELMISESDILDGLAASLR
jgi:exopolyphosphatase/guanosine-5'-triphosphate,3'-diphosphate pyrophosphatase